MLITLPLPPRISLSVAWHVVAAEKYATFLFHWLMLAFAFVVCYLLFVFLAVCSACDAVNKLQRFFLCCVQLGSCPSCHLHAA